MEAQPTLDQLQVFLAVAEEGSFSAAARRLNRAQSAISYAIANLEAQLELKLFERTGTRHPRLTEAGAAMVEDARRMAASLQLLRARARGLRQGLEAEVRLAVDVLVPMPVLTLVLKAFRATFPTVGVHLHTGALGAVVDLVLRGEADLGIAGEAGFKKHGEGLVVRQIAERRIVPVAAPDHPLALAEKPVPAAVVREHFQVVITDQTEHTRGRNFRVFAFNTWRVSDALAKHALLLEGLGWGGMPLWMVEKDLAAGRLVELVLEPYPPTDYTLFAIRAEDAPFGPAAGWLVERFERELKDFCTVSA
ncbi:LysR family transcriptional regulator [Chelativorans intermedius]|uniref:LysR family transcriptional regulator n=1 Tax=Chelativorans intermedius TaxID=515947 RepID=A0ABV6D9H7_9HYPH|nr:LysR family transcriptional regulator [Chelativorans intermedius]MCT8998570.1 LysR family transcriptional regulator [Chelativorans intermedius]